MIIYRELWKKFANYPGSKVYGLAEMRETDRLEYDYGLETKLANQHAKVWDKTKNTATQLCHG